MRNGSRKDIRRVCVSRKFFDPLIMAGRHRSSRGYFPFLIGVPCHLERMVWRFSAVSQGGSSAARLRRSAQDDRGEAPFRLAASRGAFDSAPSAFHSGWQNVRVLGLSPTRIRWRKSGVTGPKVGIPADGWRKFGVMGPRAFARPAETRSGRNPRARIRARNPEFSPRP